MWYKSVHGICVCEVFNTSHFMDGDAVVCRWLCELYMWKQTAIEKFLFGYCVGSNKSQLQTKVCQCLVTEVLFWLRGVGLGEVIDTTSQLAQLGLKNFYFLALGAGVFIDEISDPFKACQLESVGISEGEALDRSCPVVSCLCSFYLVIQQDDLGAGAAENLVDRADLAENTVGIFHGDSLWEYAAPTAVPPYIHCWLVTVSSCWHADRSRAWHSAHSHIEFSHHPFADRVAAMPWQLLKQINCQMHFSLAILALE